MTQTSPRLALPFLQAAQAQKHVTHNEALRRLDALVQLVVQGFDETSPPGAPVDGEIYAVGAGATGAWASQDGALAQWFDSGWIFLTPSAGWIAVEDGATDLRVHDGTEWVAASVDLNNLTGVGINATSDATNRLSISAPATLLNHEGAGHQLKINKAGGSDTASLLFQSNWTGHAEMGLAGNTAFSIKTSPDGSTWTTALSLASGAGVVTTTNMVGTVAASPAAGDAVIETGSSANGRYTKFADGTLICQIDSLTTSSGAEATWTLPQSFAATDYAVTASVLGSTPAVATISARASGSVDVESFDMSGSDTVTPDVCLIAVGRWT